jgi:hypothetical protein
MCVNSKCFFQKKRHEEPCLFLRYLSSDHSSGPLLGDPCRLELYGYLTQGAHRNGYLQTMSNQTLYFLITSPSGYIAQSWLFVIFCLIAWLLNFIFAFAHMGAACVGLRTLQREDAPTYNENATQTKPLFNYRYSVGNAFSNHCRKKSIFGEVFFGSSSSTKYFVPRIQPCTFSILCFSNCLFLVCIALVGFYNVGTRLLPLSHSMKPIVETYDFENGLRQLDLPESGLDMLILRIVGAVTFFSIGMILLWSFFAACDIMWPPDRGNSTKSHDWCKRSILKTLAILPLMGSAVLLFFLDLTGPVDGIDVLNFIWFNERNITVLGIVLLTIFVIFFQGMALLMGCNLTTIEPSESKLAPFRVFCYMGIVMFMFYVVRFALICFNDANLQHVAMSVPLQVGFCCFVATSDWMDSGKLPLMYPSILGPPPYCLCHDHESHCTFYGQSLSVSELNNFMGLSIFYS